MYILRKCTVFDFFMINMKLLFFGNKKFHGLCVTPNYNNHYVYMLNLCQARLGKYFLILSYDLYAVLLMKAKNCSAHKFATYSDICDKLTV